MSVKNASPLIMAVLNVTPDSFSDGDVAAGVSDFVARAEKLIRDGADVIDIGGESTRPGAEEVAIDDEIRRVLPVLKKLREKHPTFPISLDTRKAAVVKAAAEFRPAFVNDVGFANDPELLLAAKRSGADYILMHSRGTPATMTTLCEYPGGLFADLECEVDAAIARVKAAGFENDRLWLDPGFGFAKTQQQCVELMDRLEFWQRFDLPLLFAVSRKRFLQNYTGANQPHERDDISAKLAVTAAQNGFRMIRTHDPARTRNFLCAAGFVLSP